MSVVVIGGDYLGNIEKNLYSLGVTDLQHITGRKAVAKNKITVPRGTDFILLFTDYVNHRTADTVKQIAKSREIPVVYAKRSWRAIEEKLKQETLFEVN